MTEVYKGNPAIIAVDIDDVLADSATSALEYYNATYGTHVRLDQYYSTDLAIWQTPDIAEASSRINEYLASKEFFELPPIKESQIAISALRRHNYELHAVTGRSSKNEQATRQWISRNFAEGFNDVIFTNHFGADGMVRSSKASVCSRLNAGLMIEDNLEHVEGVAELGIEVMLFGDYPWNQTDNLPSNVSRFYGWRKIALRLIDGFEG